MKKHCSLISVVIPLYNKDKYILRAIESVLMQGEAVGEIIVVDDGSTDDGVAAVKSCSSSKIQLIRQANGGVSCARNAGLDVAACEYVAFLDADDVWLPHFVDELLALMELFPSASTYATSFCRVWPDGRRVSASLPRSLSISAPQLLDDPFDAWSRSSFFSISSSACVRRNMYEKWDIRFPVGEKLGEDQDVIFQLMELGLIAFSPKALMEYSQDVPNSAYTALPDTVLPCYVRLLQRSLHARFPLKHKRGARRVVATSYLNTAYVLIKKGQRLKAAALVFSPFGFRLTFHWLKTALRLFLPAPAMKL